LNESQLGDAVRAFFEELVAARFGVLVDVGEWGVVGVSDAFIVGTKASSSNRRSKTNGLPRKLDAQNDFEDLLCVVFSESGRRPLPQDSRCPFCFPAEARKEVLENTLGRGSCILGRNFFEYIKPKRCALCRCRARD
jgi:hypothetical protein